MEKVRKAEVGELPPVGSEPSLPRAWWALVWLSWLRQARLRQMVAIALLLMLFAAALVAGSTAMGAWSMRNSRWHRQGPTLNEWSVESQALFTLLGRSPG